MVETTKKLLSEIQGPKFAYTQSDEISILLMDVDYFETQAWFDYNVQKIVSISASIATAEFNKQRYLQIYLNSQGEDDPLDWLYNNTAVFDSRCFNIPKEEVVNYFIWRQQDWKRNSIQMLGHHYFSQKQLHKKSTKDIKEMLIEQHSVNWEDLDDKWKYGSSLTKDKKGWFPVYISDINNARMSIDDFMKPREA